MKFCLYRFHCKWLSFQSCQNVFKITSILRLGALILYLDAEHYTQAIPKNKKASSILFDLLFEWKRNFLIVFLLQPVTVAVEDLMVFNMVSTNMEGIYETL